MFNRWLIRSYFLFCFESSLRSKFPTTYTPLSFVSRERTRCKWALVLFTSAWQHRRWCLYCQRDTGKHRPQWLSGCLGGKVRWREANKSSRVWAIGGKSWTFRTGFDPASQSIMPVKNLAQACRIGLDFFEFLKESNRTSITDRLELREIYNTEFRSRWVVSLLMFY